MLQFFWIYYTVNQIVNVKKTALPLVDYFQNFPFA